LADQEGLMALAELVSSERTGPIEIFGGALPLASFLRYSGRMLRWSAAWTARLVLAFGLGLGPPLVVLTSGGFLAHLNR
jgi:hypothetical protein